VTYRAAIELQKLQLGRDKLQVEKSNQANDLAIAKTNAKGRNNKKKFSK
jgi:hypothetical protein